MSFSLTLLLSLNAAAHSTIAGINNCINVRVQGRNTDGTKSSGEMIRQEGAKKHTGDLRSIRRRWSS